MNDLKYTYLYKIEHWCEAEEQEQVSCGFYITKTFTDVVSFLESYYGSELLSILEIRCYDREGELSEEAYEYLRKEFDGDKR